MTWKWSKKKKKKKTYSKLLEILTVGNWNICPQGPNGDSFWSLKKNIKSNWTKSASISNLTHACPRHKPPVGTIIDPGPSSWHITDECRWLNAYNYNHIYIYYILSFLLSWYSFKYLDLDHLPITPSTVPNGDSFPGGSKGNMLYGCPTQGTRNKQPCPGIRPKGGHQSWKSQGPKPQFLNQRGHRCCQWLYRSILYINNSCRMYIKCVYMHTVWTGIPLTEEILHRREHMGW